MKKLVTLMLALSLSGSQVFAAGTPATTKEQSALIRDVAVFGGIALLFFKFLSGGEEDSIFSTFAKLTKGFLKGNADEKIEDIADSIKERVTGSVKKYTGKMARQTLSAEETAVIERAAQNSSVSSKELAAKYAARKLKKQSRQVRATVEAIHAFAGSDLAETAEEAEIAAMANKLATVDARI